MTEPVGSAAEEAAKLLAAVADWTRDKQHDWGSDLGTTVGGLADHVAAAAHDVDARLATGDDCRYCPLCRAVQVYRSASPEVREHLTSAASSLAQAAAALLDTAVPEQRGGRVEHMDLSDDWPEEESEGEDGDHG